MGYDILSSAGTLIVVLPPAVDPVRLTPDKHVYMAHGSPYPPEYTATDMEIYKLLPILLAKGEVKVCAYIDNVYGQLITLLPSLTSQNIYLAGLEAFLRGWGC